MKKEDPVLGKATRLIARHRWGDAISLLEPEIIRYRDSFKYYYILGYACLRSGDWGGSSTYFKRASEIRMRDPDVLFAMAAGFLRRGETDRAIERYLEILEYDPKNRRSKRALSLLRKYSALGSEDSPLDLPGGEKFLPPPPEVPSHLIPGAVISVVAVLVLGGALTFAYRSGLFQTQNPRAGIQDLSLSAEEKKNAVELGGAYRYILSEKDVLDTFERAQRLFLDYRDQAALVELNRILGANASAAIKRKARLLAEQAQAPSFSEIKDPFTYSQVRADPLLYQGCYVLWPGMAANLVSGEDATSFDLLVGYDKKTALEGVVPVRFPFAVPVSLERPLEVLGKIDSNGQGFSIIGSTLHQSGALMVTEDALKTR